MEPKPLSSFETFFWSLFVGLIAYRQRLQLQIRGRGPALRGSWLSDILAILMLATVVLLSANGSTGSSLWRRTTKPDPIAPKLEKPVYGVGYRSQQASISCDARPENQLNDGVCTQRRLRGGLVDEPWGQYTVDQLEANDPYTFDPSAHYLQMVNSEAEELKAKKKHNGEGVPLYEVVWTYMPGYCFNFKTPSDNKCAKKVLEPDQELWGVHGLWVPWGAWTKESNKETDATEEELEKEQLRIVDRLMNISRTRNYPSQINPKLKQIYVSVNDVIPTNETALRFYTRAYVKHATEFVYRSDRNMGLKRYVELTHAMAKPALFHSSVSLALENIKPDCSTLHVPDTWKEYFRPHFRGKTVSIRCRSVPIGRRPPPGEEQRIALVLSSIGVCFDRDTVITSCPPMGRNACPKSFYYPPRKHTHLIKYMR